MIFNQWIKRKGVFWSWPGGKPKGMYYKIGVKVFLHMKKEEVKYCTLHINVHKTNDIKYVNLIHHKLNLTGVKMINYRG